MYVLLDLDMLSASIDIIYSVHVVLLVLFAERRNFPFSTSRAAGRNTVISPEQVPKTMIARNIKLLNAYIYIYTAYWNSKTFVNSR